MESEHTQFPLNKKNKITKRMHFHTENTVFFIFDNYNNLRNT